jgi:hypothetical protein
VSCWSWSCRILMSTCDASAVWGKGPGHRIHPSARKVLSNTPAHELRNLAVKAWRCIIKRVPAARGGPLKAKVVSTWVATGKRGGDQIA